MWVKANFIHSNALLDQDQLRPTKDQLGDQLKTNLKDHLKTNLRSTGDQLETNQKEFVLWKCSWFIPLVIPWEKMGCSFRIWLMPFWGYLIFTWSFDHSTARHELKVLLFWVEMLLRHPFSDPWRKNGVFMVWLRLFWGYLIFGWAFACSQTWIKSHKKRKHKRCYFLFFEM